MLPHRAIPEFNEAVQNRQNGIKKEKLNSFLV
jgi:hypothetical protein